jgi:hypothetical protein
MSEIELRAADAVSITFVAKTAGDNCGIVYVSVKEAPA